MNVLCGKVNRTSGKLLISGRQVELSTYKKIYGFVPQDDIMHNELTVRENVLHSARMRSPSNWSPRMIESHVDNILATLNLSHVAYSIIGDVTTGGISGGQRKRVNIAMELAATPLCLCLDEPTSGLDSTAALEVTDVLSKITELGMTVIAVIHQPRVEIFRKFDDVLMIVPGGRTAFFGPTSEAKPYFESLGFEVYLDCV
jgi:ABC-type multidrug transport system ATPase subunit